MATPNCGACVLSFKVTCYMFTNPPTIYFLIFIFPFPLYINWNSYLIYNRAQLLCKLPLPDVDIATDTTPTHWAFNFQGSGLTCIR